MQYLVQIPRALTLFTFVAMGCRIVSDPKVVRAVEDTGGPSPWTDLDPVELDPFRKLLSTSIDDNTAPTRIISLPDLAGAFVLDADANRVHVLDGRYNHDGRTYCIDVETPSNSSALGAAPRCPDGTEAVSRGSLQPDDQPVAIALDPTERTVGILTRNAQVFRASADPVGDVPTDHLALDDGLRIESITAPISSGALAMDGGVIAVAAGTRLVVLDTVSSTETIHELPGPARDIRIKDGRIWVATDAGVWADGITMAPVGDRFVRWKDDMWLVQTEEDQVIPLSGCVGITQTGLLGPGVVDPRSDKLVLITDGGLVRVEASGATEDLGIPTALDLAVNQAGELIILQDGGRVQVRVDETTYVPDAPLSVFLTTFSERPRSSTDVTPCRAEETATSSIRSFLDTAISNRLMLADLPSPTALGLTPELVRRVAQCHEAGRLQDLIAPPDFFVGALMHEQPTDCAGAIDCHSSFLAEELSVFAEAEIDPSWVSGLSPHHELDVDWVESLQDAGAPGRFLFFGMSLRPDVSHEDDLRAKDPWPIELDNPGRAWSANTASTIDDREGSGWLALYPGDNVPAFNLSACANVFVNECHPLGLGGGTVIDELDVAVLDLLLHRSLAGGESGQVRTWSFHLPDIGTYDYTDGCTRVNRVWTGEDCEAARLQEWLFDVDQRLARAGLVAWTGPSDLETP